MKIGRLYTKIFFSFSAILIITLLLTFVLFILFPGRYFQKRFEQYAKGHASMVKAYLEEELRSKSDGSASREQVLHDFTLKMGQIYGAKFWITDSRGRLLFKSFEGALPEKTPKRIFMKMDGKTGTFEIERGFRKKHGFLMQIPIAVENGEPLNLHSLFEPGDTTRYSGGFALGLLVIGIFVALLVVPVARRISRPLDGLRRSALKFSRGDLSHRTEIRGKDEIAQLADAFNLMAERLEQMIKGE